MAKSSTLKCKSSKDKAQSSLLICWNRIGLEVLQAGYRIKSWMDNQHMVLWNVLTRTQREDRNLIFGPSPTAMNVLLYFNRTKYMFVTGLLTGHSTLKRHLYILRLIDSPLRRRCAAEKETAAHVLCECEALAPLRHTHLASFSWTRWMLQV